MRKLGSTLIVVLAAMACSGGGGDDDASLGKDALLQDAPAGDQAAQADNTGSPDLVTTNDTSDTGTVEDGSQADSEDYQYPTCIELNECTEPCTDDTCVQACVAGASPQAVQDLQALEDCLNEKCPNCMDGGGDSCDRCMEEELLMGDCSDENDKCMKFGDKSCNDTYQCLLACSDDACQDACFSGADKAAMVLLVQVNWCIMEECPDFDGNVEDPCFQAALEGACKTEADACLADKT